MPSSQNSTSPQASAAASDRLRPPSAITPMIARSTGGPGQGLGGQRAGLLGRWRLIPPALGRFGHDRMAGGVIAFRGPLGGMAVGDGGAGLLDGGHGPAVSCQAAEVEGDCLGFCGQ